MTKAPTKGKKRATGKKKLGRPPSRKPSPKNLVGITSKKRKLLSTQPSPYRRLNMELPDGAESSRRVTSPTSRNSHREVSGNVQPIEDQPSSGRRNQGNSSERMDFRLQSLLPP